MGSLPLLQAIFPTQGLKPGLPHCRWILYQLSHLGSPRILEWGAYPFSRGSSNPGIEPGSQRCKLNSLPTEPSGKPLSLHYCLDGMCVCEVAQSCPTLCDPMDCSLTGSSVHGIFQARVLEWVAISFSRGSSPPRNRTPVSRIAGRCFTV